MKIVDKSTKKSKSRAALFALPVVCMIMAIGFLIYIEIDPHKLSTKSNRERITFPEKNMDGLESRDDQASVLFGASYNGKSFYRLPCDNFERIDLKNKVYFTSRQEAIEVGYAPSAKCP